MQQLKCLLKIPNKIFKCKDFFVEQKPENQIIHMFKLLFCYYSHCDSNELMCNSVFFFILLQKTFVNKGEALAEFINKDELN